MIHGDTDNTPYGLGTYGSRSTPVSGAAAVLVARKVRDKAAADRRAHARGRRPPTWTGSRVTSACAACPTTGDDPGDRAPRRTAPATCPTGLEGGLEAQITYSPDNLTYPFGAYICVVDVDPGTAAVKVRRFVAVDDCGTRINEMIVEGQIQRGLTDGVGIALMEIVSFDEQGNCLNASLMDYLIPTALEVPDWETGKTVTPVAAPPDRRQGRRRVRHGRLPAGGGERGDRRPRAVRRPARGHAAHPVAGVGGHAERGWPSHEQSPMTPTQLRAFAAVVRLGSVKAAAAELWSPRRRSRCTSASSARSSATSCSPGPRPGSPSPRAGSAWPAGPSSCSASRTGRCSRCARPARGGGCCVSARPPSSRSTPRPA